MKSDKLQDAIGIVRDDYILDAEYRAERQAKVYPWVKWVAAAACLGVAVLIAVPALSGKTPEVPPEEPTPATQPVDEPVDKPVDEPIVEPIDEPTVEPVDLPVPAEDPDGTGMAGGEGSRQPDIRSTFATYDELAQYFQDPLFEAYAASEESQQHGIVYEMLQHAGTYPFVSREEDGIYKISGVQLIIDGGLEATGTHYVTMSDEEYVAPDTTVYFGFEQFSKDESPENLQEVASGIASTMGFVGTDTLPGSFTEDVNGVEVLKYDPTDVYIVLFERIGDKNMLESEKRRAEQPHAHWAVFIVDGTAYAISGLSWETVDGLLNEVTAVASQL